MKDIILIAYVNPFSLGMDGGKKDVLSRIEAIENINDISLDFFSVVNKNEVVSNEITCHIKNFRYYFSFITNNVKNIISLLPISVNNRYSPDLVEILNKNNKIYDLAIYDGTHMSKYMIKKNIKAKKSVLRLTDIESNYRYELFKSSFPSVKSIFQYFEAIKYKYVEKKYMQNFDKLLFISKSEMEEWKVKFPNLAKKMLWMPPSVKIKDNYESTNRTNTHKLLYFGDMRLSNNFLGVLWFVEKVYKVLAEKIPDIGLDIIGKMSDKSNQKLCKYNVNVHGYVDDLEEYIYNSDIIVLPIFFGAGVKIKVIEALSKGKIVIATAKAIEGTDLIKDEHLLIADTEDEFVNIILEVFKDKLKYQYLEYNSYNHIKSVYSISNQSNILRVLLEEE